jgi:hypothetical protein
MSVKIELPLVTTASGLNTACISRVDSERFESSKSPRYITKFFITNYAGHCELWFCDDGPCGAIEVFNKGGYRMGTACLLGADAAVEARRLLDERRQAIDQRAADLTREKLNTILETLGFKNDPKPSTPFNRPCTVTT